MYKTPNSEVVAVMRRSADKAADFASRHGIATWYDNASALINDPQVNAIYIATPPDSHRDLALLAAEAGKPTYVEKPMARTTAECEEMVRVFEEKNIPLYVAYYRRTLPNFLAIKKQIEEGAIGKVRTVHIEMIKPLEPAVVAQSATNWRVRPEQAGGGYFYDLASHQLDYLDFLLGPIQQATGISVNQAGQYPADDMTVGSFLFPDHVVGSGSWCFTASDHSDTDLTTITGSKGSIRYSTFDNAKVYLTNHEGTKELDFVQPQHIQQHLIEQIVGDLLGTATCVSTGKSAARTNWVMDEITKSQPGV